MSTANHAHATDIGTTDFLYDELFTIDASGLLAKANMVDIVGEYTIRPKHNTVIRRICGCIVKNGNFDLKKYGSAVLPTGITITSKDADDNVLHTFTPLPLTRLWHWSLLSSRDFEQIENGIIPIRWTLAKHGRAAILNGVRGEYMSINIPAPLAGIDDHLFQAQGFRMDSGYRS